MKKVIALLAVCGFAATFIACGGKKVEEASTTDSAATETVAPAPVVADSAAQDSTATAADTTAHH